MTCKETKCCRSAEVITKNEYIYYYIPKYLTVVNFVDVIPREFKGADTSGKYDYQKDTSICLLLEYHLNGNDYLFIFDYHDDLVIFNSELNPTEYHCCQIKGHDKGTYTINSILKPGKTKTGLSPSIIGKLYGHILAFKKELKTLNFITNREFNIGYKDDDNCKNYANVCLKDLGKNDLKLINENLQKEFNTTNIDPDFTGMTFLKVNSLSIKDSPGHTKGKLAEFLNVKYPGQKFNPDLIYQNLFDEVKRKSKYDKIITTLNDLIKHKGIGKNYFEGILNTISAVLIERLCLS